MSSRAKPRDLLLTSTVMFACIHISQPAAAASPPIARRLINLAFAFSPRVELVSPDNQGIAAVIDITGLDRLFGSAPQLAAKIEQRAREWGAEVNVGIASNMDAAVCAAGGYAGITIIPPGQEAHRLSALPLALLSSDEQLRETWQLWGLKTFGDFAALPENGVAERLGDGGTKLHRIACGAESRALIPFIPAATYETHQELECAVELLDPLCFILASLLNQVCAALEARGLAVGELSLRLKLDNTAGEAGDIGSGSAENKFERRLTFPVPLLNAHALLKLLRLDLEAHPPHAPIVAVWLRAEPAQPRVTQNSLFIPPAPEAAKLEITLARIIKLVGLENAGSPELLNTHRPGMFAVRPFRLRQANSKQRRQSHNAANTKTQSIASDEFSNSSERRNGTATRIPEKSFDDVILSEAKNLLSVLPSSLRAFRPPVPAEVVCDNNRPLHVSARDIRGKVMARAGPWRTSGDWWTGEPWDRDEWDVEIQMSVRAPEQSRDCKGAVQARQRSLHLAVPAMDRDTLLCRIYRDRTSNAWYVEGRYD